MQDRQNNELRTRSLLKKPSFVSRVVARVRRSFLETGLALDIRSGSKDDMSFWTGEALQAVAYKMPDLGNVDSLPLQVLHTFSKFDYSMPYISEFRETIETKKTFERVTTLTSDEITAIDEKKIPGLMQVIEPVRRFSENFWSKTIRDPEAQELIENPYYESLRGGVQDMAVYYMDNDSLVGQYLAVGVVYSIHEARNPEVVKKVLSTALSAPRYHPVTARALELAESQMQYTGDPDVARMLIGSYSSLDQRGQSLLTSMGPQIIQILSTSEEPLRVEEAMGYANLSGLTAEQALTLTAFYKELINKGISIQTAGTDIKKLASFAENKKLTSLTSKLGDYGLGSFYGMLIPELEKLSLAESDLITKLHLVRSYFPSYNYHPIYVHNTDYKSEEVDFLADPFEVLVATIDPKGIMETLVDHLKEGSEISADLTKGLMTSYRGVDKSKFGSGYSRVTGKEIAPGEPEIFHEGVTELFKAFATEGFLADTKDLFLNYQLMSFLANNPDRVMDFVRFPQTNRGFFDLISEGGPLETNAKAVVTEAFNSNDPLRKLQEIQVIFSSDAPLWDKLYSFTETRLNLHLNTARSEYPVLRSDGKRVPFNKLTDDEKRQTYLEHLRQTIQISSDPEAKRQADLRNRRNVPTRLTIKKGMYLHGANVTYMDQVLPKGNLCGEALGADATSDMYPFHVDFGVAEESGVPGAVISRNIAESYGRQGKGGFKAQIYYVYDRDQADYEAGVEYLAREGHALVLSGMPSTEITAVVLRSVEDSLQIAVSEILENGVYIPLYDMEGNMVFSQAKYDQLFLERNLQVPVEVWDYSLKVGGQLGSNPGAQFSVPAAEGLVRYYVKYPVGDSTDCLWNEQLADNIYRYMGIPTPETKIVRVEGAFGHASRFLEGEPSFDRSDFKSGFTMDALMANWDVLQSENTMTINGVTYRNDNGGALLFRAQGERKDDFGDTVPELVSMRPTYGDLTDEDINSQLSSLRDRFTPEAINNLVDSVRLNIDDRGRLKATLLKRRDYILSYYSST